MLEIQILIAQLQFEISDKHSFQEQLQSGLAVLAQLSELFEISVQPPCLPMFHDNVGFMIILASLTLSDSQHTKS